MIESVQVEEIPYYGEWILVCEILMLLSIEELNLILQEAKYDHQEG